MIRFREHDLRLPSRTYSPASLKGDPMKRGFRWAYTLVILASVYAAYTLVFAQQSQNSRKKGIIVRAAKPYDRVENAIRSLGGNITYEYENVDAIAASLPEEKLLSLSALGGA